MKSTQEFMEIFTVLLFKYITYFSLTLIFSGLFLLAVLNGVWWLYLILLAGIAGQAAFWDAKLHIKEKEENENRN